jgi:prevent-host-death family protein
VPLFPSRHLAPQFVEEVLKHEDLAILPGRCGFAGRTRRRQGAMYFGRTFDGDGGSSRDDLLEKVAYAGVEALTPALRSARYSGSTLKGALRGAGFMLDITSDIQSLTMFRRRSGDFIKQLKRTKRPVVLTVKGKAAAVVQDAAAYQRLLDIAARADAEEGIRQGLEDAKRGKVMPAREFFADFEAEHGIPG